MSAIASKAGDVLAGLKDFQRATVEHVFARLYGSSATRRFLVADEVGLGKTLIAKGLVAKAVDHLRLEKGANHRIDVLYLCSNGDIARQNLQRLTLPGEKVTALASRLTLLPLHVGQLAKQRLNFVSFTPATSFDLREGMGKSEERVLLYWMLRTAWDLGAAKAAINVFQGHVSVERFRRDIDAFDPSRIDSDTQTAFAAALARADSSSTESLRTNFDTLCSAYAKATSTPTKEASKLRSAFVGRLRALLATACVAALEPDLVILDEFQRFSHLFGTRDAEAPHDDAAELARAVFEFPDVRILLLSATPYKMYTLTDEANEENHYADFVRTVRFLEAGSLASTGIEPALEAYRQALFAMTQGASPDAIRAARGEVETRLRRVIARTERLASTPDRSGMLTEVYRDLPALTEEDVHTYLGLSRAARIAGQHNALELWKSAPYPLSFLDEAYALKRGLAEEMAATRPLQAVLDLLGGRPSSLLSGTALERYEQIDPGNPRMRAMMEDLVTSGAYRMLWIPPALPYYALQGAFADPALRRFTKRLVFSAWKVVPRAIAAMVSYEVERRTIGSTPGADASPEYRKRLGRRLQFKIDGERLGGMPVLALLYPSVYLAEACDPGMLAAQAIDEHGPVSARELPLDDVLSRAHDIIDLAVSRHLPASISDGPIDERWYWAAPLLLDRKLRPAATKRWFEQPDLAAAWGGEEAAEEADDRREQRGWAEHVERAKLVALDDAEVGRLGRRPEDLVDVLALLAVGGPAVTMLRSFLHVIGGERGEHAESGVAIQIRNGAARAASAFRALFNQPEVVELISPRADGERREDSYWRLVLQYCVDGCLQATLDEYVHVLRDHLGLSTVGTGDQATDLVREIVDAIQLRTSRIALDDIAVEQGRVRCQPRNIRTHFALRFADDKGEDGGKTTRADHVRKAFNSPFWPFVVASTSVGQEGLDFHTYCHAVVHWNVPSNPVDFEQREGRVHRYKGHAVRKNVASAHGDSALSARVRDRWEHLFEAARAERVASDPGGSDIVPYWVHLGGDARIERHVPALPWSRDQERADRVRRSLAIYRMVFGQPRQEELVKYLTEKVAPDALAAVLVESTINLAPGAREE